MLASILPGIRDLRAPLLAGYTCLVSLWLLIAPKTKVPSGDGGYALLYRLGQFAGRVAVLAAVSVVAYFLGILLQQAGQVFPIIWSRISYSAMVRIIWSRISYIAIVRRITASIGRGPDDVPPEIYSQLGTATSVRLLRWVGRLPAFNMEDINPAQRPAIRQRAAQIFENSWNEQEQLERIVRDIPLISSRMRDLTKERFDEFDKLRSEAELREALTPAVALLTIALCYRWSLWWASMILFLVWLQRDAHRLRVQANSVAIEAVMTGPPGIYPRRDELASDAVEQALVLAETRSAEI